MAKKRYCVNEIFTSLQGEGANAGMSMVFVRFAGCNLRCRTDSGVGFNCDTSLQCNLVYSIDELVAAIVSKAGLIDRVLFTGGEPALQLDWLLCRRLKQAGIKWIGIETNGTIRLSNTVRNSLNWITISPKLGTEVKEKRCSEVRLVVWSREAITVMVMFMKRQKIVTDRYFLSPAFDDSNELNLELLKEIVEYCKKNPIWRLSVQQHKIWRIP